jgi:hypothetical protein
MSAQTKIQDILLKKLMGGADVNALVIEWSEDENSVADLGDGGVWFDGHWATDAELEEFLAWLERQ